MATLWMRPGIVASVDSQRQTPLAAQVVRYLRAVLGTWGQVNDDAYPVVKCVCSKTISKTIIPDSEEHPLASSTAVPKAVLRWIRA